MHKLHIYCIYRYLLIFTILLKIVKRKKKQQNKNKTKNIKKETKKKKRQRNIKNKQQFCYRINHDVLF